MQKAKFCFLLLVSVGLSSTIYGQKNKSSNAPQYIVSRDSLKYIQGEFLFNPRNPEVVKFRQFKDFPFEQMKAAEVVEFGFYDGWVYQSEEIDGQYVFLKKLVTDKSTLLHLRNEEGNSYFLSNEQSDLVKLSRDSYMAVLMKQFRDESNFEEIVKSTKHNSKSLARTFLYYSSKRKYFPKFRIGAQFGLANKSVSFFSKGEKIAFKPVTNMTIGMFADIPIGVLTPFSARIEALITESSHTKYDGNEVIDLDYLVKFRTTTLPILLRYRFIQNDLMNFFLNAGFSYGIVKETFENKRIAVSFSPFEITTTELNIASDLYGGLLGFGGEYSLSLERYVGFEVRYEIAKSLDDIRMNASSFQILTSVNF